MTPPGAMRPVTPCVDSVVGALLGHRLVALPSVVRAVHAGDHDTRCEGMVDVRQARTRRGRRRTRSGGGAGGGGRQGQAADRQPLATSPSRRPDNIDPTPSAVSATSRAVGPTAPGVGAPVLIQWPSTGAKTARKAP